MLSRIPVSGPRLRCKVPRNLLYYAVQLKDRLPFSTMVFVHSLDWISKSSE
jgi:hypothetical protein